MSRLQASRFLRHQTTDDMPAKARVASAFHNATPIIIIRLRQCHVYITHVQKSLDDYGCWRFEYHLGQPGLPVSRPPLPPP